MRVCEILCAFALVLPSGCLDNLNQKKFFDLLERGAPEQWKRVVKHRERVDAQLIAAIEDQVQHPAADIGLWGETWDTVRGVTHGDDVIMRGRIFHEGWPSSTYVLTFKVDEHGEVTVVHLNLVEATR